MPEIDPDFYVGYQPVAPASTGRLIRKTVGVLAVLSLLIALVLVFAQSPFAASSYEFGVSRDYAGELVEWPYPALLTANTRYLLIAPGKFGVADNVRGHDGEHVRFKAALIARGPDKMLEVELPSLTFTRGVARPPLEKVDLGSVTLVGEIVDTKCHLGVMNPGDGKVHRDCAVRCISGGAPPAFLVRDASGDTRLLLLTGSDGRAIGRELLDYVAEPVQIPGHLMRLGATLILEAEPRDFRRQ